MTKISPLLAGTLQKKRVPEAFIIQPDEQAWPTYEIGVFLKNLSDHYIQFSYSENGVKKDGTLEPNQIGPHPTKFRLSTSYMFTFSRGGKVESTTWVSSNLSGNNPTVFLNVRVAQPLFYEGGGLEPGGLLPMSGWSISKSKLFNVMFRDEL